jgi:hypothetical protein
MKENHMKQRIIFSIIIVLLSVSHAWAQITVSGLLDSTVSLRAGAGEAPAFSYGLEEFASLRMQARLREFATVFGDVNFIAAAGDPAFAAAQMDAAAGSNPTASIAGQNYHARFELERLFFRVNTDSIRLDGGLLRLPFGYGLMWRPTDFLNPANPLTPDARLRAVLGAGLSWYSPGTLKLLGFGAAPRDPFSQSGAGGHAGLMVEQQWDNIDFQALYAFESPQSGSNNGIHRTGVSVKADVEIGLVMDLLYSYNHEAKTGIDGLSFSAGCDYSFFDGNLIVLAEYLYNGAYSSTSRNSGGNFANEHFLYTGFTWRFDDLTNAGFTLISGLSDASFTPIFSFSRELFQGATLNLTAQIPLDRDLFAGNGKHGELGPSNSRSYFSSSVKLRLRF